MAKKPTRKPISKKLRFDIFKRDDFTCQYCGERPPSVVLEIDHIIPVVDGGKNEQHNLITACFDCNRGKGRGRLEFSPADISTQLEERQEKALQLKEYEKVLRAEKRKIDKAAKLISDIYEEAYEGWGLTTSAINSIKRFLEKLTATEVAEAMEIATWAVDKDRCFKYFCGICWRKIKGG